MTRGRPNPRGRTLGLLAAVVPAATVMLALALTTACSPAGRDGVEGDGSGPAGNPSAVVATDGASADSADLYFPGREGRLYAHRQVLPAAESTDQRVGAMVRALIEGPAGADDDSLTSPLPAGTQLAGVFRVDARTVALDLRSAEEGGPLPTSGSMAEMASVYSLVNTIVLGADDVDRVVLLWNGRQPETFSGHLDLSRPLAAEPGLIASAP